MSHITIALLFCPLRKHQNKTCLYWPDNISIAYVHVYSCVLTTRLARTHTLYESHANLNIVHDFILSSTSNYDFAVELFITWWLGGYDIYYTAKCSFSLNGLSKM